MLSRARSQEGFGLIELLMSMVMLNIGILALVAAFQSGAIALQRASNVSTAAAIADIQMERYRALLYCAILFTSADVTAAQSNTKYTSDLEYIRDPNQLTPETDADCPGATPAPESKPVQSILGPSGRRYDAHVYITRESVTSARPLKRVTVVIRDEKSGKALARVVSTFDRSTGETAAGS